MKSRMCPCGCLSMFSGYSVVAMEMPKGWDNNSKAAVSKTRGFAVLLTESHIRRLRCDNDMADANLRPY